MAGLLNRTKTTVAHTAECRPVADLPAFSDGNHQRQARYRTDFVYNARDCFRRTRAGQTKMVAGCGHCLLARDAAKNPSRRFNLVHHYCRPLFFSESTRDITHAVASAQRPAGARVNGDLAVNSNRSEEHTSELQSQSNLVCRLLLEQKQQDT